MTAAATTIIVSSPYMQMLSTLQNTLSFTFSVRHVSFEVAGITVSDSMFNPLISVSSESPDSLQILERINMKKEIAQGKTGRRLDVPVFVVRVFFKLLLLLLNFVLFKKNTHQHLSHWLSIFCTAAYV